MDGGPNFSTLPPAPEARGNRRTAGFMPCIAKHHKPKNNKAAFASYCPELFVGSETFHLLPKRAGRAALFWRHVSPGPDY